MHKLNQTYQQTVKWPVEPPQDVIAQKGKQNLRETGAFQQPDNHTGFFIETSQCTDSHVRPTQLNALLKVSPAKCK